MAELQTGGTRAARAEETTGVLITGQETGGRFAMVEIREPAGASPPRHIHAHEDEVVYVLSGEVVFALGDDLLEVPAGACVLLPRGVAHTYRVTSSEARLLIVIVPAGLEDYYGELLRSNESVEGVPEVERLVALAARYGVAIVGPGL